MTKKEYRKIENYLDQAFNFLFGIIRLFGIWVFITTVLCSALALIAVMMYDGTPLMLEFAQKFQQVQILILAIAILCGGICVITSIIGNTGHFQNVFNRKAQDRYLRQKKFIKSGPMKT